MNPCSSANNSCQALCQSVGQGSLTITFTRNFKRFFRARVATASAAARMGVTGAAGVAEWSQANERKA